ncbi:MAG TPA: quinone-interacting membrane-bound oxidoreductase complex subunit QmoC [Solidesulfovibrio magneticus]|nr:quinone-interacting membrane-bound oxidoreductase complex subunit QmoC [Solidesulfovibrio magneticus]
MANEQRIKPDLQFVKDVQAAGGEAVKKCYQCATCSVACPLAPPETPFPRKEMVWAQWGLKDRFEGDIDIWLCHNCQTCSDLCPRGARPGDLVSAIRNITYRDLVTPTIIGKWMSSPKHLPKLIAIPAVLFLLIWLITTGFKLPQGEIVFGKLYPGDYTIDPIFMLVSAFVAFTFYKGVMKLWKSFEKTTPTTLQIGTKAKKPTLIESLKAVIVDEIGTHSKFNECGVDNTERYKGHLSLFYGFVALAIVTGIVAVSHWGGKIITFIAPLGHTPMPLWSPVKLLANVGAVALIYGLTMLTRRRINVDPAKSTSSYYDWYLLGVIWAVGLTGLGAEIFRLAGVASLAYPTYYLHLISVFMLFAYLPWSKLGHLVYRTTALVYAHQAGRLPLKREEEKTFLV